MRMLGTSWRQSLAGMVVLALTGTVSGDGAPDRAAVEQPAAVSVDDNQFADDWLVALRDDEEGERKEGERRAGERPEGRKHRLMQEHRKLEERARAFHGKLEETPKERREVRQALEHQLHRIQERARDIERQVHAPREGFRPHEPVHRDRPEGHGELERRLRHIHAAMENLRAAGLHDVVERLARQAERIEREVHRRREHADRDRPHPEELERAVRHVREMHERMEQMRRQMEEMRKHLQRLIERQRRER